MLAPIGTLVSADVCLVMLPVRLGVWRGKQRREVSGRVMFGWLVWAGYSVLLWVLRGLRLQSIRAVRGVLPARVLWRVDKGQGEHHR